jgi:hypothetical protein
MIYVETDSIGPILDIVKEQIDSPHPTNIEVGRREGLFTIRIRAKDAGAQIDGKQPDAA